jgi:hypothetical protein
MIPDREISNLLTSADRAVYRGDRGETAAGVAALLFELGRARRLWRLGMPWALQLVHRYELALVRYQELYGRPSRPESANALRLRQCRAVLN